MDLMLALNEGRIQLAPYMERIALGSYSNKNTQVNKQTLKHELKNKKRRKEHQAKNNEKERDVTPPKKQKTCHPQQKVVKPAKHYLFGSKKSWGPLPPTATTDVNKYATTKRPLPEETSKTTMKVNEPKLMPKKKRFPTNKNPETNPSKYILILIHSLPNIHP